MEKEKLFYSEEDILEEAEENAKDEELTKLISADNARTQYSLCAGEITKTAGVSAKAIFGFSLLMILFLWLSFSVFPQHRFAFNFGEGTYSKVLVPSVLSGIMAIIVLLTNFVIQVFGFVWNRGLAKKLERLVRISKRLELRDLMLDATIFNRTSGSVGKSFFHGFLIVVSLVALVAYVVVYLM